MYFSDKKMDNITFFDYIWNDFRGCLIMNVNIREPI